MITLHLGSYLNARTWAEALARVPAGPMSDQRVLIDLTELGFADFVTLGQLLVFVRATTRSDAECVVRLPRADALPIGTQPDSEAAERIVKRHNCRLYLEQTGVADALRPYKDRKQAEAEGVPEFGSDGGRIVAPPTSGRPHRYRRILRYRWLPKEMYKQITLVTEATDIERELRELGLSAEIAAAVTRGMLLELVENAALHGTSDILLGGVVVDPQTYRLRADDFDPSLKAFAEHAAETGSPMLRMVVADLGEGISNGVAALDERSSGAADAARGLWKVGRMARAYEGALLLTTRGGLAGRIYLGGETVDVPGRDTSHFAGAFVECDLLARPSETAIAGPGALDTPRPLLTTDRTELACMAVPIYSPKGLSKEDLAVTRDKLAAHGEVVVAINIPHGGQGAYDVELSRAVNQVIGIVADAGGARPVTVAFPSVNRPLMSVAVGYLNAESDNQAAAGVDVAPPILVLAPENRHYWVGGTAAQRTALGRLSTSIGPLPITNFSADQAEVVENLSACTGLISVDGDRVALQTTPQDAFTTVAAWVGERLASAISHPSDDFERSAVWRGRFLTPSLRETSRWFDLDALLSGLDLRALASVTLAARVEAALHSLGEDPSIAVLRLPHTPEEVAVAVTRAVTGRDRYCSSVQDLPPGDGAKQVLLVTDVVSSGITVIGAITEVLARGLEPVAVAAVVDARDVGDRAAHPAEVEVAGRRVPLVSVAVADIPAVEEDGSHPLPIDPVLRRPEQGNRPMPSQLIDQKVYLHAMKRNSAARLGHIERPADRHYTAYVDPTLLFREQDWSGQVLDALVKKIKERHHAAFAGSDAKVSIMYPEGATDNITVVVKALRTALFEASLNVYDPVPVPRAAHSATWQVPESVAAPTAEHVVILDSGASSGRTVRQMVGLAADQEATTISVVVLLNGLNDSDAVNLERIATVRRTSPTSLADHASVETYYVSRTAMSSRRSDDCGVCGLRERYASMTFYTPVPDLLEKHREWLIGLLGTRTKQDLFAEQTADLFGANVGQPECVEYLRWRLRLRDAEFSIKCRQRVVRWLDKARDDRQFRDPLVRLLVAESHWLNSAPLDFPYCREIIKDMASSMLAGSSALLVEARLRVQAAILLARLAPERFADELGHILRVNRDDGLVIPQVLLETLLLLTAHPNVALYPPQQIARQVADGLDRILDSLRDQDEAPKIESRYVTLTLIRYLLLHTRRRRHEPPAGKQEAWARLRHQLDSAAHDFSDPLWYAKGDIDLAADGRPDQDPDKIYDYWILCRNHLQEVVLPCLEPLRDILLSSSVLRDMERDEVPRWDETLSQEGPQAVERTTVRVFDVVENIRSGVDLEPEQVEILRADLDWWGRLALDSKAALLREIITRGPVDILGAVRDFFNEPSDEIDAHDLPADHRSGFQVFCTDRLINSVFAHIRKNARMTHRNDDPEQHFRVEFGYEPDRITVTVRNTGSSPQSRGSRKGQETLRHRLERFGGTIQETDIEHPWTYAVMVELERWRAPA